MPEQCHQLRLYRGQDYEKLRAKCLTEGQLFVDPEFPANRDSLGFDKEVEWKRPTELVEDPKFLLDANRFSVVQGELGDCWFMSAMSAITLNPGLLKRVVPSGQEFTRNYIGIFHFRFWQSGEWVDVVVDDQLPVTVLNQLCFSQSRANNEFWSALLEKAYAKLHGSYSALDAGKCYEATEDLTGGITERFPLQKEEPPSNLFSFIMKARQRGSLITCNVAGKIEKKCDTGLVAGHGYCLTGTRRCKVTVPWKTHVELVRLRNPWGDETEWRGSWSDNSEEWCLVPKEERKRMKLIIDDDGEFWMTFVDFKKYFDEVCITSLNPQNLNKEALDYMSDLVDVVSRILLHPEHRRSTQVKKRKEWEVVNYDGSWVRNSTAGGPPTNFKLFSTNPQYVVSVTEADDDAAEPETCTVMVSLTQKNRRIKKLPMNQVSIVIYKVGVDDNAPCPVTTSWLRINNPMMPIRFSRTRTVTHRLHLKPGKYIIVPCTAQADQEGEFLLRLFCEKAVNMEENDEVPMILNNSDEDVGLSSDETDGTSSSTPPLKADVLRDLFMSSVGKGAKANATKLQNILTEVFPEVEFSLDLSRSLLALMDRDLSGNVDYYEFETLVHCLTRWMNVYNSKKDIETKLLSGRAWGLGDALKDLGYQLPRRLQGLVVVRYGNEEGNITLRDFLMAASRISVMLERFQNRSANGASQASISLAEWLQDTLYC